MRANQAHRRPCFRLGVDDAEAGGDRVRRRAALAQIVDPAAATILARNAHDEARNDLLQLLEQHRAVRARLRQRVREQVQDELLIRLTARVHTDV